MTTRSPKEQHMSNQSPRFEVLLRSEQSNDQIAMIRIAVPPGWAGPPLHHHDFDEAFYVLDGELTFQLGAQRSTAGPGTLTFAPRGSHHTLANLGAVEARYLLVCTPGAFERYFDRLIAEQNNGSPPVEAFKPYPETIVVGPPIEAIPQRATPAP
jgi:mannose-6-phosphate isomerase-like protein (cupin superfamily)